MMEWTGMFAEKALEWLWAVFVAAVGYVWRLEAAMHKHRTRLELLEAEMRNRVDNARSLQAGIDRVASLVETHRIESADRMSELRRELREDIKILLSTIRNPGGE